MAREFDELQPRRRGAFYVERVQDPAVDTFRQRFAPFSSDPVGDKIEEGFRQHPFLRGTPIMPGSRERFGDPTKVISQNIPPQISNTNMRQFAQADVTDQGIPAPPRWVNPNFEYSGDIKVLRGGPKSNMPSQMEIDATLRAMEQHLIPPVPAPETTGVRPPPPRGLGLPEGGQGLEGVAAGTLPPPDYLRLIELLHQQRNEAQGIPGRALGGKVEANQPYVVGEKGKEVFVPDRPGTIVALPPGATFDEGPATLPPGATFDEESTTEKASRVFQNVKPQGPISGLISLIRTAGQAAKGQRPDLLTNPEGAIPEAVQGMVAGTGARAAGTMARTPRYSPRPEPPPWYSPRPEPPPQEPLQLASRLSPEDAAAQLRGEKLAASRQEGKRVAQGLRDTGQMPPEPTGAQIDLPGPATPPPPESSLLPPQLIREFSAVRKGVELKERLNPGSEQNLSAKEQAMQSAIRPHLNNIEAVTRRTQAPIAALEAALPSLSEAVSTPGKAASVANWVRVYERAARAKFSSQAKASLELATRNLNNNLGTELTLKDVLRGE